jgi:hypothetical protein
LSRTGNRRVDLYRQANLRPHRRRGGFDEVSVVLPLCFDVDFKHKYKEYNQISWTARFPQKMTSGDQSKVVNYRDSTAPVEPSHRQDPASVYESDRYGAHSPYALSLLDTFGGSSPPPPCAVLGQIPPRKNTFPSSLLCSRRLSLIPAASILRSAGSTAPRSRNVDLSSTSRGQISHLFSILSSTSYSAAKVIASSRHILRAKTYGVAELRSKTTGWLKLSSTGRCISHRERTT